MLGRALILGSIATLVLTAPADAATYHGSAATWMAREEARAAVPPPSGTARAMFEACPDGGGACTYTTPGVIFLDGRRRFHAAHERGHLFIERDISPAERPALARWLGFPATAPWDDPTTGNGCGSTCVTEIAADAYAACALRLDPTGRRTSWETSYGYAPGPKRHRRVCAGFRAAAR